MIISVLALKLMAAQLRLIPGEARGAHVGWPQTRAEATKFSETSHFSDVIRFIEDLQRAGAPAKIQYIGVSAEGKKMPLVVLSRPQVSTLAEAKKMGKPVVYIQANIHAGEVEGKEAIMHLMRKYSQEKSGVLDKIVLVVCPIYNIDGNEKFGPQNRNRPGQGGPEMVGQRANGQGLDLNRDYIKAETPEFQAGLSFVYKAWDPDVMMDLHTTDGTRHGYALTYAPPLNPNTEDGVEKYARDVMMVALRKQLRTEFSMETFDYGNAEKRGDSTAWYEVGPEGRYSTNYVGLRNRIGILSEALTYLSFQDRIVATERFTNAVIEWTADHAKEVLAKTKLADQTVVSWGLNPSLAPALGVRFDWKSRGKESVLLEKKSAKHEGVPKDLEKVNMEIYDRFSATKTARFPGAYFIPSGEQKTIDLLRRHGVLVEKLTEDWAGVVDLFSITAFKQESMPFQGHKLITLDGSFRQEALKFGAGDFVVRTAQPLGILAFHILEPESLDGAVAWGVMGETYKVGGTFPIAKCMKAPVVVAEGVD